MTSIKQEAVDFVKSMDQCLYFVLVDHLSIIDKLFAYRDDAEIFVKGLFAAGVLTAGDEDVDVNFEAIVSVVEDAD